MKIHQPASKATRLFTYQARRCQTPCRLLWTRNGLWSKTLGSQTLWSQTLGSKAGSKTLWSGQNSRAFSSQSDPFSSIVKVFVMKSMPNFFLPWQNKAMKESIGTGFCIEGKQILTNAHVVANQKYVQLKKLGSPIKYTSKVVSVDHECDLALLTVEDEEFWQDMPPLLFGDIPELQDEVRVAGYPIGGDNISVTQGVVSRVEPQMYVHGSTNLLAIQIDAAINPGNSGGPALRDNTVIGVAFQNLTGASNIGFIIPTPIVHHFLQDSLKNNNKPEGFCQLGVLCQTTENISLQKHMMMTPSARSHHKSGVLVNKIHPFSSASGHIEPYDIMLELDGHEIACDGTIYFRQRERICYSYLFSTKHVGDKMSVKILRNGQIVNEEITMKTIDMLVPAHQWDITPSYFIFAGMTFINLTRTFLQEYACELNREYPQWERDSPRKLVELAVNGMPDSENQQVVILSQMLMSEVNHGYQHMLDAQIVTVNGTKVLNLGHLKDIILQAVEKYQQKSEIDTQTDNNNTQQNDTKTPDVIAGSSVTTTSTPGSFDTTTDTATGNAAGSTESANVEQNQNHWSDAIVVEFSDSRTLVIDIPMALGSHTALLEQHRVPCDRSSDLL